MRYKITIEYFGRNFHGWQKNVKHSSIQNEVEVAIYKFTGCKVNVFCAGRTDSGVNAFGQVAHFDLENPKISHTQIMKAMNYYLQPHMITVLDITETDENFHARFSAKARHYEYKIMNRESPLTFERFRLWHVKAPLDIELMRIHAKQFEGKHDLSSFRDSQCQASSPIKNISSISIEKHDRGLITISISAPSFLHKQVRIIVGTLVYANLKKKTENWISEILEKKNRIYAGPTAPPDGLYFVKVEY